jgi:Protein of unknown function (DUF1501)
MRRSDNQICFLLLGQSNNFKERLAVGQKLLQGESEATRKLYGPDEADTQEFGLQCLLARRLVERGVRFVELLRGRARGLTRGTRRVQQSESFLIFQ